MKLKTSATRWAGLWLVGTLTVPAQPQTSITPGVNKHMVRDSAVDVPGAHDYQCEVRLCASDRHERDGMVLIPAGEFQMGDTFDEGWIDEQPLHAVYVDAFYIDTYEVTNQRYCDGLNWAWAQGNLITVIDGVVYQLGSGTSYPYCDTTTSTYISRITWDGSTFGVVAGKENHPMGRVSWYGSVAYCNWRSAMEGSPLCYDVSTWTCNFTPGGYRLPTEAEWEKAARGGSPGHRFPWFDQETIQHARSNYYSSIVFEYDTSPTRGSHPCWGSGSLPFTSPVGFFTGALQYQADWDWPGSPTSFQTASGVNGYGLYDMAGNAWEWCNDWYSSTYYSSSPYDNPHGPASEISRVIRGGCWDFHATLCRVAARGEYSPAFRYNYFGLRCVSGIVGFSADLNGDGNVDADDFSVFATCMTGPDITTSPPGATPEQFARADFDGDLDVDLSDVAVFQVAFSGSGG
jgi:sulfatase modifying factor 1